MRAILTRRLLVKGYIVTDHSDRLNNFLSDMSGWLKRGQIRYREDITEGLENAVSAFQGLLRGDNTGKTVIKVSGEP
jgi:NADPH-dependent curcumin reductase CurA